MNVETGRAELRRLVAVVPVRALEGAKSRLGDRLDPEERQALVLALLDRTIRAAEEVAGLETVVVVSQDPTVLRAASSAGATPIRQLDDGLNEGLRTAARWAMADGATALLVLAADLPAITALAIRQVVAAAEAATRDDRPLVVLVADRHGRGTNALLISPPDAIPFTFGHDSRAAHLAAASVVGAAIAEPDSPLSLDLDLPEDLILAEELGLLDPARVG